MRFGGARSGNPKSNTPVVLAQVGELGILSPAPPLRSSLSPGEQAFAEAINARLAKSVNKDVSIYVHGFRVDFGEATRLLGSLHHYLLSRRGQ